MVGGRDLVGGGMWLGCTKHGRIAFLTNYMKASSFPHAKTRGDLPIRYWQPKEPAEFAQEMEDEIALYNGFNLVVADVYSKSMIYITNRPKQLVMQVSPGKKMVEEVMTNTVKDQVTELLPQVYTPEMEYNVSSIFIDIQIANVRYGTRSILALTIKSHGEVCFYEKHLEQGDSWKEHTEGLVEVK